MAIRDLLHDWMAYVQVNDYLWRMMLKILALENSLRLALLKLGLVIPQTDAEVEMFDQSVKKLSTPPEALSDPFACLDPSRVERPRIVANALYSFEQEDENE